MSHISKARQQKFSAQGGFCFYCEQPMWECEPHRFAERFALYGKKLGWLQSTAEHLNARCDGGRNTDDNIVAACRFCNTHRHHPRNPMSPDNYGRHVRKRLAKGKWHRIQLRPRC